MARCEVRRRLGDALGRLVRRRIEVIERRDRLIVPRALRRLRRRRVREDETSKVPRHIDDLQSGISMAGFVASELAGAIEIVSRLIVHSNGQQPLIGRGLVKIAENRVPLVRGDVAQHVVRR